ncbi:tetratricopeptide repeat protein [Pedomonas mirosovicensis]|uniref:tetratricopeptide repeat protein n=1 Tax=Pedomonas mirosovicensis TaxID=2908641 RepID=UPI0021685F6D|nr:hypothetical protein [Pedomonas mirosovicensis]MCH8684755.1 hypothetical protein [Pedomonas mirosovicensis]
MRRFSLLTVTVAFGVLAAGSAVAGVTVLGTGKARACYEAAEGRDYTRETLTLCSEALSEETLSQRDRAATLVNRGIVKMGLKDVDGAVADYETALGAQKRMGEAYVNLGIAYMFQKKDREALQALSQGLALNPAKAHVGYYTRAIVNELLGDVRSAYFDYQKAAELAPTWDEPRAQLQRFRVISSERKLS